jgi:hypothetical protein
MREDVSSRAKVSEIEAKKLSDANAKTTQVNCHVPNYCLIVVTAIFVTLF